MSNEGRDKSPPGNRRKRPELQIYRPGMGKLNSCPPNAHKSTSNWNDGVSSSDRKGSFEGKSYSQHRQQNQRGPPHQNRNENNNPHYQHQGQSYHPHLQQHQQQHPHFNHQQHNQISDQNFSQHPSRNFRDDPNRGRGGGRGRAGSRGARDGGDRDERGSRSFKNSEYYSNQGSTVGGWKASENQHDYRKFQQPHHGGKTFYSSHPPHTNNTYNQNNNPNYGGYSHDQERYRKHDTHTSFDSSRPRIESFSMTSSGSGNGGCVPAPGGFSGPIDEFVMPSIPPPLPRDESSEEGQSVAAEMTFRDVEKIGAFSTAPVPITDWCGLSSAPTVPLSSSQSAPPQNVQSYPIPQNVSMFTPQAAQMYFKEKHQQAHNQLQPQASTNAFSNVIPSTSGGKTDLSNSEGWVSTGNDTLGDETLSAWAKNTGVKTNIEWGDPDDYVSDHENQDENSIQMCKQTEWSNEIPKESKGERPNETTQVVVPAPTSQPVQQLQSPRPLDIRDTKEKNRNQKQYKNKQPRQQPSQSNKCNDMYFDPTVVAQEIENVTASTSGQTEWATTQNDEVAWPKGDKINTPGWNDLPPELESKFEELKISGTGSWNNWDDTNTTDPPPSNSHDFDQQHQQHTSKDGHCWKGDSQNGTHALPNVSHTALTSESSIASASRSGLSEIQSTVLSPPSSIKDYGNNMEDSIKHSGVLNQGLGKEQTTNEDKPNSSKMQTYEANTHSLIAESDQPISSFSSHSSATSGEVPHKLPKENTFDQTLTSQQPPRPPDSRDEKEKFKKQCLSKQLQHQPTHFKETNMVKSDMFFDPTVVAQTNENLADSAIEPCGWGSTQNDDTSWPKGDKINTPGWNDLPPELESKFNELKSSTATSGSSWNNWEDEKSEESQPFPSQIHENDKSMEENKKLVQLTITESSLNSDTSTTTNVPNAPPIPSSSHSVLSAIQSGVFVPPSPMKDWGADMEDSIEQGGVLNHVHPPPMKDWGAVMEDSIEESGVLNQHLSGKEPNKDRNTSSSIRRSAAGGTHYSTVESDLPISSSFSSHSSVTSEDNCTAGSGNRAHHRSASHENRNHTRNRPANYSSNLPPRFQKLQLEKQREQHLRNGSQYTQTNQQQASSQAPQVDPGLKSGRIIHWPSDVDAHMSSEHGSGHSGAYPSMKLKYRQKR